MLEKPADVMTENENRGSLLASRVTWATVQFYVRKVLLSVTWATEPIKVCSEVQKPPAKFFLRFATDTVRVKMKKSKMQILCSISFHFMKLNVGCFCGEIENVRKVYIKSSQSHDRTTTNVDVVFAVSR